jgi:hypothetical protein
MQKPPRFLLILNFPDTVWKIQLQGFPHIVFFALQPPKKAIPAARRRGQTTMAPESGSMTPIKE